VIDIIIVMGIVEARNVKFVMQIGNVGY